MNDKLTVCWLSAGVSSFVAGYLIKDEIDKFIYIDIEDQRPDSMRFIKDCETALDKPIEILKSPYGSVESACRGAGFISSPYGAKCTQILKKRVRQIWEHENIDKLLTYVWGFDCNETKRADRLVETMIMQDHRFPLIEKNLTKDDAHGICNHIGIKRPAMYDLGYNNNNCIGCVKGGMGYWNKIRADFPEVFANRAKMERDIGASCIKGVYLDELDPSRGRMSEEVMQDCSIFCQLAIDEAGEQNG